MTLIVKVILLNFAYIIIALSLIYRFDSYLDKETLMNVITTMFDYWSMTLTLTSLKVNSLNFCINWHNFIIYLQIWFIFCQNITCYKLDMIDNSKTLTFKWLWLSRSNYKILRKLSLLCHLFTDFIIIWSKQFFW